IKAYLSCNIELDKAMGYLMERLEEAGVADRTAIVIAGDHFPYGLSDEQYAELTGEEIDDFSKYKSSLIFWVGGLEQNIVVDEYCCNVDILPTILNLWGFTYDSRLLAGTDVFSDGTHVAVLIDKSWLTDKVWFNANTGEIRYQVPENQVRSDYIEAMNRLIATRFSISADILNSAYYNFVFDKGEVSVNRIGWNSKK
ncbi:MAG: sulfatase-like hydrolase/transferase, partial [Oscillospiraceae bacterium]|nr:sulfatase-like hydrolase/transferase [Oscillospiraceae bacterium]